MKKDKNMSQFRKNQQKTDMKLDNLVAHWKSTDSLEIKILEVPFLHISELKIFDSQKLAMSLKLRDDDQVSNDIADSESESR